jgi:hypothetical protein
MARSLLQGSLGVRKEPGLPRYHRSPLESLLASLVLASTFLLTVFAGVGMIALSEQGRGLHFAAASLRR